MVFLTNDGWRNWISICEKNEPCTLHKHYLQMGYRPNVKFKTINFWKKTWE
jgi:hypothetical protein